MDHSARNLIMVLTDPIRHQAVSASVNAAVSIGDVLLVGDGVQEQLAAH